MPAERGAFQVEEPSTSPPQVADSRRPIAAAGGVLGLILVIVIGVAAAKSGRDAAGPGDGGGGDTGGGDTGGGDDVIVDPVGPPAEKVIWAYHDGDLYPYQLLCKETIEKHCCKGDFEFKLLNKDTVMQHISMEDLPKDWSDLNPRYKRDAAVNALLARHGGIALDINTIMFRSLEHLWENDIDQKDVAFSGYYYKSRAETATWFMMVGDKGTGMMQTVVERQKKLSGNEPAGCMEKDKEDQLCYGSSVISFALCTHRSEYCTCYKGVTEGCELLKVKSRDTDAQYDLTDPRKTVQSDIEPDTIPKMEQWQPLAVITEGEEEEAFQSFRERFNQELPFITLQAPASETEKLATKSRDELLATEDTFFYQWLCRAQHKGTAEGACSQ